MKKMVMVGVVGVMLAGGAQASEGKVEFGFFDTVQNKAKKFEDAFRQNDRITGINVDGRSLSLGGEWVVLNSWSLIQPFNTGSKYGAYGALMLGRVADKKLLDTMSIRIDLIPPSRGEFKTAISKTCVSKDVPFYSDVSRAEDKYQSCIRIDKWAYHDKGTDENRAEAAVKGYANSYGLTMQSNGSGMYGVDIIESRYATGVYVSREVVREGTDPEELKRFAQDIRRSIQRDFFKD